MPSVENMSYVVIGTFGSLFCCAGHGVNHEQPEAVNREMIGFLQGAGNDCYGER